MKNHLIIISILILALSACTKDETSNLKGIVQFDSYTTNQGLKEVVFENGQIKFVVQIQLSGSSNSLNAGVSYQLLDGDTKISEGTADVNQNLDGGLGMFWGADEETVTIDTGIYSGKTLTVYLDPENKYTDDMYTTQEYVELYKKGFVVIP